MAILKQIPEYTIKNSKVTTKKQNDVYIDDIFDPLFNAKAREYLNNKYGLGPIGNTLAGYAEGIDNALLGQNDKWGMFGPGMGILSGFGRSMDKADDFILGGLTEGVNAFSHIFNPNIKTENPITNIFVEDQDYTGSRLLAAMTNTMSQLAGGATVSEDDFKGLWNIPGTAIELATDPGILGGTLSKHLTPNVYTASRANKLTSEEILKNLGKNNIKSTVGEIGQLLSNYDDLMANVALDLTAPGLRSVLHKTIGKINELVKAQFYKDYQNINLTGTTPDSPPTSFSTTKYQNVDTDNSQLFNSMLDDLVEKYNITPKTDPETFKQVALTKEAINENIQNQLQILKDAKGKPKMAVKKGVEDLTNPIEKANANKKRFDIMLQVEDNKAMKELTNVFSTTKDKGKGYGGQLMSHIPSQTTTFSTIVEDPDNLDKFKNILYKYLPDTEDIPDDVAKMYADAIDNNILEDFFDRDQMYDLLKDVNKDFPSTKSHFQPVKIYESKYLERNQKPSVYALSVFSDEFEDLLKKLSNTYDIPYTNARDFQKWIFENNEGLNIALKETGNASVPGLGYLLNLNKHTKDKDFVSTYFQNIEKLTNWLEIAEKANQINSPATQHILDYLKEFRQNYLDPLYRQETHIDVLATQKLSNSPINTINTLLRENPTFFRRPDGSFDFKKLKDIKQSLPSFDVKISGTDELVKITADNFGFNTTDINNLVSRIDKLKNSPELKNIYNPPNLKELFAKDPEAGLAKLKEIQAQQLEHLKDFYTNKEIKNLIGTSKKPTPLYPLVSYLMHPSTTDSIRLERLKHLKNGEIPLTDLTSLISSKNYVASTLNIKSNIGDSLRNLYKERKLNLSKAAKETTQIIEENVKQLDTKDFANTVLNSTSSTQYMYDDLLSKKFSEYAQMAPDTDSLEQYVKTFGTSRDKYLFDEIQNAMAVGNKNKIKNYGITRNNEYFDIERKATQYKEKISPDQITKYLSYKDALSGDTVKGADYLNNLITSNGYNITITRKDNPMYEKVKNQILANNKILDPEGKFLRYVEADLGNGDIAYALTLNTDYGKELPRDLIKFVKNAKTSTLQDVVWETADPNVLSRVKDTTFFNELDDLFNQSQNFSQNLSKTLGFTNFNDNYFKHALNDSEESQKYLGEIYKKLGIDTDALEDVTSLITQDLKLKGTFGSLPYTRSLRGNIYRYNSRAPVFSTDLVDIIRSTYTKGMMDNTNFQTYLDLFENGNFLINQYAKTPDDLKRILFAKDGFGEYTGNLTNMSLIAAKKNDAGKLIGFTEFDKFSDKGLQQALSNPNTILVPTESVAHLQSIVKKDAKMSNKWYAFFNRNLVLPWKFGILSNPGFLVGNYSDAYFKQALTMSRKYGTSITEELTNVLDCNRIVNVLNNKFSDVYTKYVNAVPNINVMFKNPASILANNASKKAFIDFLNGPEVNKVLNSRDKDIVQLFMYMNNVQSTTMFKDVSGELNEINKSRFNEPKSKLERILMGTKGSADEHIGLFTNNPIADKFMDTSETIENTFRSGMILNDLRHKGYTSQDIIDLLNLNPVLEKSVKQKLDIDVANAINTMNTANFSYDATGPLIDTMAYVQTFPTFYLKNIAYWLGVMVENPQIIDNILSVQQGLWQNTNTTKDQFKAEAKGRGAITVGTQSGQKLSNFFKGIYKPSPLNSMFSAFNSLNNPIEDFMQRLKPPLRLTTYPIQDNENVRYRPYSTNQYERNIKRNDRNFNPLQYAVHSYNPYERVINTYLRTPGKLAKGQAQLSDILPSIFQPDF